MIARFQVLQLRRQGRDQRLSKGHALQTAKWHTSGTSVKPCRVTTALAKALRAAVAALNIPHPILDEGARVIISLGVAAATAPQVSAGALIGAADAALYAAKHAGRDCLFCA